MRSSLAMFSQDRFSQVQAMKEELISLKKSNMLKDDTIAFLQREKENLIREVRHYEGICAGVQKHEQELRNLRTDIQHWKEVVKRYKHARKSISRDNTALDPQHHNLIKDLQNNLNIILSEVPTENSLNIQRQVGEIIERSEHETCWHLLEATNNALVEIQSLVSKYKHVLEATNKRPVMKYSHTMGAGPIPHSQASRSAVTRMAKQSMMGMRRASSDLHRTQSATVTAPEFQTIPGFLPGLKKHVGE